MTSQPVTDQPATSQPTVRVRHPEVATLLPAAGLYADVLSGRWEAVARVCAEHLADPDAAASDLVALRRRSGYTLEPVAPLVQSLDGDVLTFSASRGEVVGIVDLYSRVLTGQWREVDWLCRMVSRDFGTLDGLEVEVLRVRHQRPGAYPELPGGSWSIGNTKVPVGGRLAYNVWKSLGGGVADRHQLPLGAPVQVTVTA